MVELDAGISVELERILEQEAGRAVSPDTVPVCEHGFTNRYPVETSQHRSRFISGSLMGRRTTSVERATGAASRPVLSFPDEATFLRSEVSKLRFEQASAMRVSGDRAEAVSDARLHDIARDRWSELVDTTLWQDDVAVARSSPEEIASCEAAGMSMVLRTTDTCYFRQAQPTSDDWLDARSGNGYVAEPPSAARILHAADYATQSEMLSVNECRARIASWLATHASADVLESMLEAPRGPPASQQPEPRLSRLAAMCANAML